MTLETAKRIKMGNIQGQGIKTIEQLQLLNKEAEAVLRGGMTICENKDDGSRKYTWIKVFPTKTDDESSIQLAIKDHQGKRLSQQETRHKKEEIKPIVATAERPKPEIKNSVLNNEAMVSGDNNLSRTVDYLKRKFDEFVKIMDDFVEE